MPAIIGLTGGYGCGKTTVAGFFRAFGARVLDADNVVAKLYRENASLRRRLAKTFGKNVLTARGLVNRKRLAEIAFSDAKKTRKLNRVVHPLVKKELVSALRKTRRRIVVLVVPLLFEAGFDSLTDFNVVVHCTLKQQLARLAQKGVPRKEALQRINAQLPLPQKRRLADVVIDNSGSLRQTRRQAKKLFDSLHGAGEGN